MTTHSLPVVHTEGVTGSIPVASTMQSAFSRRFFLSLSQQTSHFVLEGGLGLDILLTAAGAGKAEVDRFQSVAPASKAFNHDCSNVEWSSAVSGSKAWPFKPHAGPALS